MCWLICYVEKLAIRGQITVLKDFQDFKNREKM